MKGRGSQQMSLTSSLSMSYY